MNYSQFRFKAPSFHQILHTESLFSEYTIQTSESRDAACVFPYAREFRRFCVASERDNRFPLRSRGNRYCLCGGGENFFVLCPLPSGSRSRESCTRLCQISRPRLAGHDLTLQSFNLRTRSILGDCRMSMRRRRRLTIFLPLPINVIFHPTSQLSNVTRYLRLHCGRTLGGRYLKMHLQDVRRIRA